jgi:putative flippase GtrA
VIALGGGYRWARFLLSGGAGFALYYVLALLLRTFTVLDQGVAAFLATMMAIPPTFFLQRTFTFRSKGSVIRQLSGYAGLQAIVALVIGASAHMAALIHVPPALAFFMAGVIGVVFSYFVQLALIFSR